jgi:hypothetical protein
VLQFENLESAIIWHKSANLSDPTGAFMKLPRSISRRFRRVEAVNAANVSVYTFRTPCVCLQRRMLAHFSITIRQRNGRQLRRSRRASRSAAADFHLAQNGWRPAPSRSSCRSGLASSFAVQRCGSFWLLSDPKEQVIECVCCLQFSSPSSCLGEEDLKAQSLPTSVPSRDAFYAKMLRWSFFAQLLPQFCCRFLLCQLPQPSPTT